jgi:hypothetical protein
VDEVEVDRVHPQGRQAPVERRQRFVAAMIGIPQLGGDEDVLS